MSRHEHTPSDRIRATALAWDVLADPLTRMLLDEQTRLTRQRNLTLVFLEDLIGAAAATLSTDAAKDTPAQNGLRQQLLRSQGWAAHLCQRDLVATRRGSALHSGGQMSAGHDMAPTSTLISQPPAETGP